MFLQCHVGIMGAHRGLDKTRRIITRHAWWSTLDADVTEWISKCITCLRFRKMAKKQESPAEAHPSSECWEEVMIDLEGPFNPADKQGNHYSMTYICCLCRGILTERSTRCNGQEARRMFALCMLRSGTLPRLVLSDRGPELKNALLEEYTALVGIGRRYGTPWRPMEQGLVEGAHVETQKIMGMLVKDIMTCYPNETGELERVVEFIVYNTPGKHGFTPRDIDRRWSLASPLEKELRLFEVLPKEPVSTYVSRLYQEYRDIRVRVLAFLKTSQEKRAELANRYRKNKVITPGTSVILRDPRHRKAGGRAPYRQPYSDPCEVTETHGNKCTCKRPDGTLLYNIHMEDLLVVPDGTSNLEQHSWQFPDEDLEVAPDDPAFRRSPGLMIEDDTQESNRPLEKPGKIYKMTPGMFIAYVQTLKSKICHVGKILNVSRAEAAVVVHRYAPTAGQDLRVHWRPLFIDDSPPDGNGGSEVFGSGSKPSEERVTVNRILTDLQLHDHVMSHAVARDLDLSLIHISEPTRPY